MNLHELAIRLLEDYDHHSSGSCFDKSKLSFSIDQSYELQHRVAALREQRGEKVAGYKIGCISKTMQKQLFVQSCVFGYVWESELHPSGCKLDFRKFDGLAVEGELAIRVSGDVKSHGWLRRNLDVIASGFVVIELHNYTFRGSISHRACELIANNAIHAGVVMPIEETLLENVDSLSNAGLRVTSNGKLLGQASGNELEGGVFLGILRLTEHLAKYGRQLQKNQIVLTGSPLPLWRVAVGDHVQVTSEFGKLAEAVVR